MTTKETRTRVPGYDGLSADDLDVAREDVPPKPGASVVLFPYDFRVGVAAAAEWLDAEVRRRLADHPDKGQRVAALTSTLLAEATAVLREWPSTYDLLPRYRTVRDPEALWGRRTTRQGWRWRPGGPAAVEDVASGDSPPWMTMRWLADGFLSDSAAIATLP